MRQKWFRKVQAGNIDNNFNPMEDKVPQGITAKKFAGAGHGRIIPCLSRTILYLGHQISWFIWRIPKWVRNSAMKMGGFILVEGAGIQEKKRWAAGTTSEWNMVLPILSGAIELFLWQK
jgi:hypothetical protein